MRKKISLFSIFLFVFIFFISTASYSQTPIPITFKCLYVSPSLKGGIVISNETYNKDNKYYFVGDNGKTLVRLHEGSVYVIKIGDKYFYPNGDPCVDNKPSAGMYVGNRLWINGYYDNGKLVGYGVIWPPD